MKDSSDSLVLKSRSSPSLYSYAITVPYCLWSQQIW